MNELKESLSQDINELGQAKDTDITLLSPISDKQYQLYGELLEKEADELENKTSYQQVATAAINQNWIEAQVLKQIEREDVLPSTDWKVTPEEYSQLIEGIPQDLHDEFNDARSLEHAFQIKGEIQDALKNQEELMAHGPVIGIGASMVASVVDPVALGMTAATEGIAAPFLLGNKVSRLRRIISAGLINTTSAAVVEGTLANMDPTVDMDDVLLSMAGAFVLGSGVSTYRTRFDNAVEDFRKAIELDAIRKTGGELTEDGKKYYAKFLNEDGSIPTPEETASTLEKTLIKAEEVGTAFGEVRADLAGINLSSDLPEVRQLTAALVVDGIGGKKGQLMKEAASLWKRLTVDRFMVEHNKSLERNFNAYLRAQGKSTVFSSLKNEERHTFNKLVSRQVRHGDVDDPFVQAHAAVVTKQLERVRTMLQKPQGDEVLPNAVPVKGAEEVAHNPNYMPRRWSASRLAEAITNGKYTHVQRIIASSFHNVDGDAALELAGAVMDIVLTSKKEVVHLPNLNKLVHENIAEYLVNELGVPLEKAKDAAKHINKAIKKNDAGKASHLKNRIDLDEKLIEDFLENDAEVLLHNYFNTMVGYAALARQGFESEAAFKEALKKIEVARSYNPGKTPAQQRRHQLEIENLKKAYDHIVGRPVDVDPSSTWSQTNRIARKIQFVRVMSQVGFAQAMEMHNVLCHTGWTTVLKHLPSLRHTFKRMENGDFRDALLNELSDAMGSWCNGRLLHHANVKVEDFAAGSGKKASRMDTVERGLDHLNKATADISGFHIVNSFLQNIAAKSMAQRFLDYSLKGKKVLTRNRLREIGIDDGLLERIANEFRHASHEGGKLTRINFDKWDPEVYAKFSYSLRLWGSRIIQEQDFGDTIPYIMTKELGKTLLQFRSFMITAYTKQLLHGMKHRDIHTVTNFITATFFAGFVYTLQTHAQAVGRKDREDFLKRRLSPEAIAKASFQRASYASIFPMLIDSASELVTGEPIFNARTTELATNIWTGNATYDWLQKTTSGLSAISKAVLRDDYSFTQEDWYNLSRALPFQNLLIIQQGLSNIGANFPRYSEE